MTRNAGKRAYFCYYSMMLLSKSSHRIILALCLLAFPACRQGPQPASEVPALRSETVGPPAGGIEEALAGLAVADGRIRVRAPLPPATSPELDLEVRRLLLRNLKVQAVRVAARAVRSAPGDAGALCALSFALRRAGRLEKAAAAARSAIDLEPRSASGWTALARALERLGERREALAAWHDVAALEPPTAPVHRRLAALAALTGDRRAAARHAAAAPGTNWPLGAAAPPSRVTGNIPVSVGPAVRIDSGGGTSDAAEVSLAASAEGFLVAAWNDLREATAAGEWRLGWSTSDDGGLSWSDGLLRPPGALAGDFEGDPMTAFDEVTGTLWVGGTQFSGDELYLSRRLAGETDFSPPAIVVDGLFLDRAQLAVGADPSAPAATLLHMAHITGLQTSADLGDTWTPIVAWPIAGFAHHPATGPDGEVYVTYSDFNDLIVFQRSLDGGATLEPAVTAAVRMDVWDTQDGSRFPGRFRVAPLPFLASSPVDGTLYCLYFDTSEVTVGQANVDLYLTVSSNRGDTWSTPAVINGDGDPPGDQFLPWIEVDAAGRVHVVFFDSRHTPQLDDVEDGRIDVYHAVSADHGTTWTETRLTGEPFGTDVIAWPLFPDLQFLGDYLGLATAGGRTWVAYPTTENGDLDVFVREIFVGEPLIFADGFESGDTSAWAAAVP